MFDMAQNKPLPSKPWKQKNQARVGKDTNQDTSDISVLETLEKPWNKPHNGIKWPTAKLTVPTYPIFFYMLTFLFKQHTFCVAFYSNNLFTNFQLKTSFLCFNNFVSVFCFDVVFFKKRAVKGLI